MNGHQIRVLRESETKEDVLEDVTRRTKKENAFMILELDDIVRKVKRWRRLLPRVDLFYAVKCNSEPAIIETLVNLGCGFDCASKNEMKSVLDAGGDSSRIIFAHTVKWISHLRYAKKAGIALMTFDNPDELYKIKQNYCSAKLLIRIRCDDKQTAYQLGNKFGAEPEEAESLLQKAKDLGLDVVGVAFHVGSMSKSPSAYAAAIAASRRVFDQAVMLGFRPYLLDIGGGFIGTKDGNFAQVAEVVNRHLDLHFPEDGNVKIIAEPGRYVVGSSCTLATLIIGRREKGGVMQYYINDGQFGCFERCFDHIIPVPVSYGARMREAAETTIFGQTCAPIDIVHKGITLPIMQVGEWLMWEDMGAYSLSLSSNFNGFEPPRVILAMSTGFMESSHLKNDIY